MSEQSPVIEHWQPISAAANGRITVAVPLKANGGFYVQEAVMDDGTIYDLHGVKLHGVNHFKPISPPPNDPIYLQPFMRFRAAVEVLEKVAEHGTMRMPDNLPDSEKEARRELLNMCEWIAATYDGHGVRR